MSRFRPIEDYGCTDGGCIFGHPGGMHTNGGCRCLYYDRTDHELRRRATKGVLALRETIAELRAELEATTKEAAR